MKIHTLSISNINSLKGTFTIDFTKRPLQDCGLFAITGPTGAGKTTLLDALTLALYGDVARRADVESVMSYGCGECSAEVVFQTARGHTKRSGARDVRGINLMADFRALTGNLPIGQVGKIL